MVGVARPAQRVGGRFHALSRAECGEMQDRVEGARWLIILRDGYSVG